MLKKIVSMLSILFLTNFCCGLVLAAAPGDVVENFTLNDHQGNKHELYQYADKDLVLLFVQGNGCPIVRNALHTYADLRDQYKGKNVAFLMINSNLQDDQKRIAKEATEFKINFPILVDAEQSVGEKLRFERTADVFVINPRNWRIEYRGALDDRLGYETQKFSATKNYVADAMASLLAGQEVKVKAVEAKGCLVNIPALAGG